jgi:hypothetical protein
VREDELATRRYEAIFRAVGRRNLVTVVVCVAATALVTAAFVVFVVPAVVPLLPGGMHPYVALLATMAIFLVGVTLLPTVAQLVLLPRPWLRAVEALNATTLNERARWLRAAGQPLPRLFSRGHARRWIRNNPGVGGIGRIRLLVWTGELNAAAQVAAGLPRSNAKERFDRALIQALIEFVATGRADLDAARAELAMIEAPQERDEARLDLAVEESRLALAAGQDWVGPLAVARAAVDELPSGATLRERFLASLPSTVVLILVVATIAFVLLR